MAKITISPEQGYVLLAEGPCQIQIFHNFAVLGIVHSLTPPPQDKDTDFLMSGTSLQVSLGAEPCYVKAMSDTLSLSYTSI